MIRIKPQFAVYISLFIALILMVIHLPYQLQLIKPAWISLVLIYWILNHPSFVGVGVGFSFGLLLDILGGSLLGSHALTLSLVVYFTHKLRNRVRLFSFWQQAFVIFVLIAFGRLVLLILQWLLSHPIQTLWYWVSTLTSVLIWPLVFRALQIYERKMLN